MVEVANNPRRNWKVEVKKKKKKDIKKNLINVTWINIVIIFIPNLFLSLAGGSNSAGPYPNPVGQA